MKLFCRKGDLIRLLVPTISAWQGIGIAADKVYDDGDPDTVVPFFKQDQPLDDQAPSIALIGDVELIRPTNREIDRLIWQSEQNPQGYRELVRKFLARWGTSNLAQARSSLGVCQPVAEDDVDLYLEQ